MLAVRTTGCRNEESAAVWRKIIGYVRGPPPGQEGSAPRWTTIFSYLVFCCPAGRRGISPANRNRTPARVSRSMGPKSRVAGALFRHLAGIFRAACSRRIRRSKRNIDPERRGGAPSVKNLKTTRNFPPRRGPPLGGGPLLTLSKKNINAPAATRVDNRPARLQFVAFRMNNFRASSRRGAKNCDCFVGEFFRERGERRLFLVASAAEVRHGHH